MKKTTNLARFFNAWCSREKKTLDYKCIIHCTHRCAYFLKCSFEL